MENSAKQREKSQRKACIRAKVAVLVMAGTSLVMGSHRIFADDYLDALANEAESTANVTTNSKQLSPAQKKQFKEMEALLEREKPSTYKFYEKLSKKNKKHAFEDFASDSSDLDIRLSHLQKKVMDLYFSQK